MDEQCHYYRASHIFMQAVMMWENVQLNIDQIILILSVDTEIYCKA